MMKATRFRRTDSALAVSALLITATTAWADDIGTGNEFSVLDGAAVSDRQLDTERGRQGALPDFQIARSGQTGTVDTTLNVTSGASLNNGANTIDGQALSGMYGIGTVVQNSGNQVIIQDATNVNLQFLP